MKITLCLFLSFLMSSQCFSSTVANVQFDDVITANQTHPQMNLNGAALRELYLLIKMYAGALYLENKSASPQQIIDSEQHKRMVFHVIVNKVGARKLTSALQEALLLNITPKEHEQIQTDLNTMLDLFTGKLVEGDETVFHYIPKVGTQIFIKDEYKTTIKGKGFFDALLKVWIGDVPVSRDFKTQILGSIEL